MNNWPVIKPLIGMIFSRKFITLVLACLAAYGLPLKPELEAIIYLVAATFYAVTTAWEDNHKIKVDLPPVDDSSEIEG